MLDSGKDAFLLPYTYTPSSNTVVPLPSTLAIFSEVQIHDFQNLGKRKCVSWQPGYYNLLSNKKDKILTFLRYSFFWKRTVTISLKKLSSNTIFSWYVFFYKHNVYKHIQAQVLSKNKHMISILLSLKLTAC